MLLGGMGGSLALNPDQVVKNGLTNEGVALLSEYIVAIQLGLTGGAAGHSLRLPARAGQGQDS